MRAAAIPAGANSNGLLAERKRNVGVRGGQARHGFDSQVSIDGADNLHNARLCRQLGRRTVANTFNLKADLLFWRTGRGLSVDFSNCPMQTLLQLSEFVPGSRPQIHART